MKKGLIKISDVLYQDNWELAFPIFKYFRPFHIDTKLYAREIVFYGECDFFEELKEGEIIPQYDAFVKKYKNGTYSVRFKRIKP